MEIRLAEPTDLPELLALYARARQFMRESGNPDQWKDRWPDRQQIEEDIANRLCYLCVEGRRLLAAFAFLPGPDPTYGEIRGEWPDDGDYSVVHRIATGGTRVGAGEFCLRWCRARCRQLRIDTHEDNRPMRSLLGKLGFRYCGMIRLENGEDRLAYCL